MFAINPEVEALMFAIKKHEGWVPPDAATNYKGSRSYRNHNPGNLRRSPFASGIDDNFAVFESDFLGWFALYFDLHSKARGNTSTRLNGSSTIYDLIHVWAPPSDNNDTEAYIVQVEKMTGLSRKTTLATLFAIR